MKNDINIPFFYFLRISIVFFMVIISTTGVCYGMDAQDYNNRGLEYAKKGEYDQAITDFNKAIELNPTYDSAYNNRGFAYLMMGKYNEAERDIKKSLELNSNNVNAMMSMSELYSAMQKINDSCSWLKKSIEKGYNNFNYIKTSRTLDNIRNSSCYKEILSQTETKQMESIFQQAEPMIGSMIEKMMDSMFLFLSKPETADKLATFTKNYYDALIKKGFSRDEALRIVISVGVPLLSMGSK